MIKGVFSRHSALGAAVAGLSFFAVSGAAAQAAVVNTSACDGATLTQPFAPWGDTNYYKAAPGGTFEGGATGWTLSGGAKVVAGSEPFAATGTLGASSLSIPAGGSATSPYTCVNAAYPTIRFFAKNSGLLSTVVVSVVYKSVLGLPVSLPVGTVALGTAWAPSAPMLTASAIPAALSGGTAQVALKFSSLTGSSQIDDVFVDPRMHG